jgi:zinc transport system ATP-binding protein
MTVLRLSKLKLGYEGKVVIDGADLVVESGDFVCVVGANGSGKSTLIKGILGLIKPLAGEVIYGEGVSQTAIGYLPQEAKFEANFPATVGEIVLSGALGRMGSKPFYGKAEHNLAQESMKTLKITELASRGFVDLSGGQRQKVLLARSLVATSKMLILDEPSNNLDQTSRKEFYKILKRLNQDSGLTILMITHDLDAEDLIGNKVAAIKNGKVAMFDTKVYLESYR